MICSRSGSCHYNILASWICSAALSCGSLDGKNSPHWTGVPARALDCAVVITAAAKSGARAGCNRLLRLLGSVAGGAATGICGAYAAGTAAADIGCGARTGTRLLRCGLCCVALLPDPGNRPAFLKLRLVAVQLPAAGRSSLAFVPIAGSDRPQNRLVAAQRFRAFGETDADFVDPCRLAAAHVVQCPDLRSPRQSSCVRKLPPRETLYVHNSKLQIGEGKENARCSAGTKTTVCACVGEVSG